MCHISGENQKLTRGQADYEEPPAKMTKLAIVEEREEDMYEHITVVKCWHCDSFRGRELPDAQSNPQVSLGSSLEHTADISQTRNLVDKVMQSMSSARQSEVKAWEEEITPCEHTLTIEQHATAHIAQSGKFTLTTPLLYLMYYRSCDVQGLRSQRKPVALSYLWLAGMRKETIWRYRRERAWFGPL